MITKIYLICVVNILENWKKKLLPAFSKAIRVLRKTYFTDMYGINTSFNKV